MDESTKNQKKQEEEIAPNDNNNSDNDGVKADVDDSSSQSKDDDGQQKQQQQKHQEDLETITAFIAELTARFAAKREDRQANDPKTIDYPDESFFGRLDSSIKKNTAFVKKLRNMTEAGRELILKDLASLNLSRYVSELASALVETKLKLTDIGLAVTVCSLLHRRYAEFSGQLLEAWTKNLPRKPTDPPTFNAAKMRIDVRLFTELILAGVFGPAPKEALSLLGAVLTVLTTGDREAHNNLAIVLGFVRQYGNEFAGLVPRRMRLLAEAHGLAVPICDFLSAERQKGVRHLLKEYFASLVSHLHRDDKRLRGMEGEMRRVLVTRGEVAKHQKEAYEGRSVEFKKLWATAEQLADLLDEELPAFSRDCGGDGFDGDDQRGDVVFDFSNRFRGEGSGCPQTALWEDEETRTFYESLPDLKSIIPAILYKDSLKDGQQQQQQQIATSTTTESSSSATNSPDQQQQQPLVNGTADGELAGDVKGTEEGAEKTADGDLEKAVGEEEEEMEADEEDFADSGKDMATLNENDELEIALSSIQKTEQKQLQQKNQSLSAVENLSSEVTATTTAEEGKKTATTAASASTSSTTSTSTSTKSPIDVFFASLLKCVNRDFIDKAALTFATTYNTKTNRKKLVNVLFTVPRTRLDLLPFYARFVAQLSPIMPTVGGDLVSLLKHNFRYLFKKKDQINIESKVKNIRFIGELVKFGVFPKPDALYILKTLLSDFRHHHIEMACNLLETAGQYLYRSPDSHPMTSHLLDQLMRHKARMALDSRYAIMVENAYYVVNPPEDKLLGRNLPTKPPITLYIEHLLYTELTKNSVTKVLIKLRKLNWEDPETSAVAISCLASVWQLKYFNIVYLAHLLYGLYSYQEWVVPRVLDTVLEDIRLGLQMSGAFEWNQRRLAVARFLAECFNYRLIDSGLLFRVLYLLITYGVNYEDVTLSPLDPPANLMRLRLVATILHATGGFLTTHQSRKKLDYYIYFYQRYYWLKKAYLNSVVAAAISTASETTKESKEGKEAQQQPPTYVGGGGNTNSADLNAQFYIDSIFRDVITYLKPRFRVADSYETACRQLETHLKGVAERAKELMPNSSPLSAEQVLKPSTIVQQQPLQPLTTGKGSRRGSAGGLEPIVEEADCEEDLGEGAGITLNGDNDSQDGYDEEQRCFNSDGEYAEEEEEEDEEEEEVVDEEEEDKNSNKANNSKAPAIVGCTEDDEFQRDFERMLTESLTSRSQEVVRPNVEIVIPIERGGGGGEKKKVNSFADEETDRSQQQPFSMALNDRQSTSGDSGNTNRTTFRFRVMARNANKSNKPLFRSIEVSPESELVQNFLAREEELRAQKEAVKRVILDINQRRELQEDSAGGGSSSGSPSRSSTDGSSSGGGGYSSRGGGHYSHHQQHYQQQHYHHGGGHYQGGGGHYSGGGGGYYHRQGGGGSGYYHNSNANNNNSGNNSSTNSSGNNSGNNNNSSGQNNTINYQQYRRRFN